ncbi:hypothetical protein BHM03_00055544 [Ensete ventricosum]|nr:hypothetical protein BHM03_00055544 [Ensete ventricosum]
MTQDVESHSSKASDGGGNNSTHPSVRATILDHLLSKSDDMLCWVGAVVFFMKGEEELPPEPEVAEESARLGSARVHKLVHVDRRRARKLERGPRSYLRMCLDRCRLTCTIAKETQCARTIENETERPHCTGKGKTSGRGSVTSPSSTAAPGCGFRRPRRKARPLSMDSRLPVLDLLDLQERWQLD